MPIRQSERARYPENWPEISAAIKTGRAGGRCECVGECGTGRHGDSRCEARHGQPSPYTGSKVTLTTAHLDHQPERCDPANLKAMCELCHNNYDRDHRRETRLLARRAAAEAAGQEELYPELAG